MASQFARRFTNPLMNGLWPRYRGTRAGRLVKSSNLFRLLQINTIPTNDVKRGKNFNRRNLSNLIPILPSNECHSNYNTKGSSHLIVPSLLLSNVMSLSPKIDEVRHEAQNANYDLICITESWLQNHIPDSVVSIDGFNLVRLDRKELTHGGVCLFVKESISFSIIQDLQDENLEVLWLDLRPNRLPRGISNIVIAVIYHPPKANNSSMLNYLTTCLSEIESRFNNCGLILLGDLNHLDITKLKSNYSLKQIVHFPTRGRNFLDKILTNLRDHYDTPIKKSPFGLSDLLSVEVQPKVRPKNTTNKITTVKSRNLKPSTRLAMRSYLEQVDVANHISSAHSCEDKTSMLESIVRTGLDFIAPVKTKTVYTSDPPWINSLLKSLIKKRQSALRSDDQIEFRRLRNAVNRERKIFRAKYYNENVKHLKECSPANWWKEVKKLSGKEKPSRTHDNIIKVLKNLDAQKQSKNVNIANTVNSTLLAPMKDFPTLPDQDPTPLTESPQKVTPNSVMRKLFALHPTKAQGPDGIPGWLLKKNADLLADPITEIVNSSFLE